MARVNSVEQLRDVTRSLALRTGLVAGLVFASLGIFLTVFLPNLSMLPKAAIWLLFGLLAGVGLGWFAAWLATQPLRAIGQAIFHVAPETTGPAPNIDGLSVGREYVNALAYQVYQIASLQDNKIMAEHRKDATQASNILNHLPLPVYVFNKSQIVTFATEAGISYVAAESSALFGKPLFEAVDLEFQSDFTLESWITDCAAHKATDTAYWRRVRVHLKGAENSVRQCDIAGYYNRDNPSGIEFIITLFDHTESYNKDESNMNYIALAVHELRTPLTIMRGYIEALQEETAGKLVGDEALYMTRMTASAKQLTAFVNNILNVARISENQLTIKMAEEKWPEIVNHAVDDMSIRSKALKKNISVSLPAALPTVGADRVTIYEVLTNLIDNALKYSGESTDISIKVGLTKDGLIETTVEDHGVGIPTGVMPTLFEKFHRNHRNKGEISGTGLGLYISKAIVNAHGGDIWVNSKEGEGTRVTFTLKPFTQLAQEEKNGNNEGMVRTAHGWIKNHSLYRR